MTQTEAPQPPQPAVPEFTIERYSLKVITPETDDFPTDINDFADTKIAYNQFCLLDNRKYTSIAPNSHYFRQYLNQMYSQAKKNHTITVYEYNSQQFLDFPLENPIDKVRLFASFIPNKNSATQQWFLIGIRKGGKINDIARQSANLAKEYEHLQKMTDLKKYNINSRFELRSHLEDAFIDAAESNQLFEYTIADRTYIEYPTGLSYRDGRIITVIYIKTGDNTKLTYSRYQVRDIDLPLEAEIKRCCIKDWKKAQKAKIKEENEKQQLKLREEEWKLREAEKQLIPFTRFNLEIIEQPFAVEYYNNLKKFAYIKDIPHLFIPAQNIDIRDSDIILDTIEQTFSKCNPYTDITYYQTTNGLIAEFPLQFENYPDKKFYITFDQNTTPDKQPWHLSKLHTQSIIERTFDLPDSNIIYEDVINQITADAKNSQNDSAEIFSQTPEEFKTYLKARIRNALKNNEILRYGDKPKFAELPLGLQNINIHLIFTTAPPEKFTLLVPWKYTGCKIRPASDARFVISDEYKALLEQKNKSAEQEKEEIKQSQSQSQSQSSSPAKSPAAAEVVQKGEMITGPDGKPLALNEFSREINDSRLKELAIMTSDEKWGYDAQNPYSILYKYLKVQFIRLSYEEKILVYRGQYQPENYAAFHTGLFTKSFHDPIYACFRPAVIFAPNYTGPQWTLDGFCSQLNGGEVYNKMMRHFKTPPQNTDFMKENGQYIPVCDYLLDTMQNIILKEEHILKERGYRIPYDFLYKIFDRNKDSTALKHLATLKSIENEEEKKSFWINTVSEYLESNPSTYEKLLQQLQYVVDEARNSNDRRPLPTYYPRDNVITWLLPLRFHEDGNLKNLALLVRKRDAGGYKGVTLLTIEPIYHRIRVIENPENSWLKTEILDNYIFDESEIMNEWDEQYLEYDEDFEEEE